MTSVRRPGLRRIPRVGRHFRGLGSSSRALFWLRRKQRGYFKTRPKKRRSTKDHVKPASNSTQDAISGPEVISKRKEQWTQDKKPTDTSKEEVKAVTRISRPPRKQMKRRKREKDRKNNVCDVLGATEHKDTQTKERTVCKYCGKILKTKGYLPKHMRIHTGEKPYACKYCGKSFRQKCYMTRHEKIRKCSKPTCSDCGKSFRGLNALNRHKASHSGEKPFHCDYCGKAFRYKCHLKEHKRIHTGEKPYSCDVCGLKFRWLSLLKKHRSKHNETLAETSSGKVVERSNTVTKTNTSESHSTGGTVESSGRSKKILQVPDSLCPICRKTVKGKQDQNNHFKQHAAEFPYKCSVCRRSFNHYLHLEKHVKIQKSCAANSLRAAK